MRLITCPNTYNLTKGEVSIFLAGGITNCPDWQKEMAKRFEEFGDNVVLINPRRTTFDTSKVGESAFQIEWEYHHIHKNSSIVLFWFPWHTMCPITLYELGTLAATSNGPLVFVGCHPAYARKFDVEHQLSLIAPHIQVRDNFTDLVSDVKQAINTMNTLQE